MIKLLIIIGAILLLLFWLFGSYLIKYQEWLNENDD